MNIKRLTILRDALIEHAKNPGNLVFDLRDWASVPFKYGYVNTDHAVASARRGENFCGTTACALGLATTIPSFRRAGLCDADAPTFRDKCGAEAGALFFGISINDAEELFFPQKYLAADRTDPLAVADKITALLETA